jgi:ankyrin repeat protein
LLEGHLDQYLNSPDHVGEGKDSNTPLHIACKKGHLQVVAQLVSFGPALKTGMLNANKESAQSLVGTEKPACDPRTGAPWQSAGDDEEEDGKAQPDNAARANLPKMVGSSDSAVQSLYDDITALLQPRCDARLQPWILLC